MEYRLFQKFCTGRNETINRNRKASENFRKISKPENQDLSLRIPLKRWPISYQSNQERLIMIN
ncbi:hypothetical protein CS542_09260 [Pedobacter sp. IW39]|nr:hypothetical protein CS542_09260 [Pedobacter sp. IW39]